MISKRLRRVADMVTKGYIVADIGTDHGYVPIYLVKHKICPKAYAMDINEGPLRIANANIENEGLKKEITTVLANGMESLREGQADSVIIAGMGGELIVQILQKSKVNDTVKEFILSPHKNAEVLRKYLLDNHFVIVDEVMLQDGGKYYTIIKAIPINQCNQFKQSTTHNQIKIRRKEDVPYTEAELLYGRLLIEKKDKILEEFLLIEEKKFTSIYEKMVAIGSSEQETVKEKLQNIRKTLEKIQNI